MTLAMSATEQQARLSPHSSRSEDRLEQLSRLSVVLINLHRSKLPIQRHNITNSVKHCREAPCPTRGTNGTLHGPWQRIAT